MRILFIVARVLLVLIFIVSGASKLLYLGATAQDIGGYVSIPDGLAPYATQLQQATGMTVPQLLAIIIGVVEVVCGLLIVFNIATRTAAAVLAIFTLLTIIYVDNFWTTAGAAQTSNFADALKHLSIMGGLLTFVVLGSGARWRRASRCNGWRSAPPRKSSMKRKGRPEGRP